MVDDGWKITFLLGWPIFRGHVSFRECSFFFLWLDWFWYREWYWLAFLLQLGPVDEKKMIPVNRKQTSNFWSPKIASSKHTHWNPKGRFWVVVIYRWWWFPCFLFSIAPRSWGKFDSPILTSIFWNGELKPPTVVVWSGQITATSHEFFTPKGS